MNRKLRVSAFLFLFWFSSISLSQAEEEFLSSKASTLPVTRKILDNGMTVLLKEVHRTPVVSIMAYVKTGSAHEGEWTGSGISHAIEHMIFKGTDTRGVGEIEKQIRSYGGDINAFTSHDTTGYTLVVNRDHYKKALAILSDCLTHPAFDAAEFEKEKEVILGEIRLNRDNPSRRLFDTLWQNVYRNHPYRYPVIGYENLLKQLSRDDLLRYYHQKYVANNTLVVLVGDFQTEEAFRTVQENFSAFERKSLPPEPIWNEMPFGGGREAQEEGPFQMAHIALGYYTVRVADRDMYPLDVLAILLGEGESSRLVKSVHKEKRLVYNIEAFHDTPIDPGVFMILAVLEKKNLNDALKAIQEEIKKLQSKGVNESELKKAKRHVVSGFYFDKETLQSQARDLAENEAAGLDSSFSEKYVRAIASVKAEDVLRVAKQYLREDNLTLVTLVPPSPPQEGASKKKTSSPQENQIQKIELPNGIRALLQRDPTQPTVSLGVSLLGGLRFETAETEGISNFVSRMIPKGTAQRNEKEISEWIDAQGASFTPFSGQNSFGLRLKLLKEDTGEGLRLLKELVAEPAFPEEEFEKEKKQILGEIQAEEDDIFKVGERLLRRTLYTKHPYRFYPLGTAESVSRLSREDLIHFYSRVFSTDKMVVTVFGDIDLQKAAEEIRKIFSTLGTKMFHPTDISQEPPLSESLSVFKNVSKEQAVLFIGFHGISLKDDDYYPFEVLTGVLSGGGGKLFSEIREKQGQAYTLGVYSMWGLDPGHYVFYVATTPKEISDVQGKLFSEIESLRHAPIPDQEIERAKEGLIGMQKLSLETPDNLSFHAALDELYGLGYSRYLDYEKKIRSVTAEDLQRIASRYFNSDQKAVIWILPEGKEGKNKQ